MHACIHTVCWNHSWDSQIGKFIYMAYVLIRYSITVVLLTISWKAHYFSVTGMHNEGTCLIKHCCSVFEGFGDFFFCFLWGQSLLSSQNLCPRHVYVMTSQSTSLPLSRSALLSLSQSVLTPPWPNQPTMISTPPTPPLPGHLPGCKASRAGTAVSAAGA